MVWRFPGRVLPLLLGALLLGTGGCAPLPSAPGAVVAVPPRPLRQIVLLPTVFVATQPSAFCHPDLGDELRGALARGLRDKGYVATTPPDRTPASFARGPAPPPSGTRPALLTQTPAGSEAVFVLWVEDFLAPTLCERNEPQFLQVQALGALYLWPEGTELGRWRTRVETIGGGPGTSREAVWQVSNHLADALLRGIPPRSD